MFVRLRLHQEKKPTILHQSLKGRFQLHSIVPLVKRGLWVVTAVGHEGFVPTVDLTPIKINL